METAPVALFCWKRPAHTERVLQALVRNERAAETELYVFIDGPRQESDIAEIEKVVQVVNRPWGFARVTVTRQEANRGLASSLVSGVSAILTTFDRVIVLEDDILVSPQFLSYMNDHLEIYAKDEDVASIHAYVYPHPGFQLPETFFIRGADCWGWATWRRAWEHFNPDGQALLDEIVARGLLNEFNYGGAAPFSDMLVDQIRGRNDSWAIRWYATALVNGMQTLYPSVPMAVNIGEDGSGTHGGASAKYGTDLAEVPVASVRIEIKESDVGRSAFESFFRSRYRIPRHPVFVPAWRAARSVRRRTRRVSKVIRHWLPV